MIKVNNLSKEFHEQGTSNELLAVDHVDFTIQNGSFCALVGESGSGKSTLAQLMCGLLVPSSGEVLFEGKNISLCRGKQKQVLRSKIQLILQDGKGAMDPRFTVEGAKQSRTNSFSSSTPASIRSSRQVHSHRRHGCLRT